jgi:hypothetical protein
MMRVLPSQPVAMPLGGRPAIDESPKLVRRNVAGSPSKASLLPRHVSEDGPILESKKASSSLLSFVSPGH